ncbi:hypothetical protein KI688_002554 [Linnemannia hyalina]|uniref:DUF590-domain-containing protein n=1 Tax=Linnemannia hyalina TaxID=64524 RepID=A0A9P8BRQ4_9FUNG|nr:hypothetical protein KI688_002554 [Linnemannia hyalina]
MAQQLGEETMEAYQDVLNKLANVGLRYESRPSTSVIQGSSKEATVLIFVLCPWAVLKREAIRNGIHDWLTGVKVADTAEAEEMLKPAKDRDQSLDDLTEADRIRLIHDLITGQPSEGGAGIYPTDNEYVESILPLHDDEFNKTWLRTWSLKWLVNQADFTQIRDHFGEKVTFYFQYLENYFVWLIFPTALGIIIQFFGRPFSIFYSACVLVWAVFYIECWKRREKELALVWGVRNVTKSENRRPAFKGDSIVTDPVTGEQKAFFSPWKRWARKVAGLPVIFAGALALSVLVTFMFGVEVFLEVYYGGYMKDVLVYVPTVLFTLAMPYVEDLCNDIAKNLTDFENYETDGTYDYHLVQKVFIFKVLNSYLSVLLTAYVYIPFGPRLISVLQSYGLPFATVAIEPSMLKDRLRAFMVSNQVISFFTETIYPWMSRKLMKGAAKVQREVSEVLHHHEQDGEDEATVDDFGSQESEEVRKFLKTVQNQVDLPVYDVNEDYAEMVEQFGFVSLFSVIWPLTGLCAFINNWVELRSDAAKICFHTRRPIPSRTDSIGPWIDHLQHLTWFSSLTNASMLYLFRGAADHKDITGADVSSRLSLGMMLLCVVASEHVYLGLRWTVRTILESIPTEADLSSYRKEYGIRASWLTRLNSAIGRTTLEDLTESAGGGNYSGSDSGVETGSLRGSVSGRFPEREYQAMRSSSSSSLLGGGAESGGDLGAQAIQSCFKTH